MIDSSWWQQRAAGIDPDSIKAAEKRQTVLTKPPGALGKLESLAIQLAGMLNKEQPQVDQVEIVVFAGDHGVVEENISAFPQVVTYEMVKNFSRGGAAINVLANSIGAGLAVVNLGTVVQPEELPGVINRILGPGTANFARQPAMTETQVEAAMQTGREMVVRCAESNASLFIGGDMGIGNTTASAALCCALMDVEPESMAGPGTGLDSSGVSHKAEIIKQGLSLHAELLGNPFEALRVLGGFEIAALTGAYIACAQSGIPVLVDGFISSTAALCATRMCPGCDEWFLYSHSSAEPGHKLIMQALDATPLLDLGLRLGEGSGAVVAVPLLRQACVLHNEMATFAEAGVSDSL